LVAIGLLIGVEAISRLIVPATLTGGLVLGVALAGAVVNNSYSCGEP
jgi:Co/Zn/Cd efflux system component